MILIGRLPLQAGYATARLPDVGPVGKLRHVPIERDDGSRPEGIRPGFIVNRARSRPKPRNASTTSPPCSGTRAIWRRYGRFTSARSRSTKRRSAPTTPTPNRGRCNLARVLVASGCPADALPLAQTALAAHGNALGPDHPWTQDSAGVTADALEALGRTEDAGALRARHAPGHGG